MSWPDRSGAYQSAERHLRVRLAMAAALVASAAVPFALLLVMVNDRFPLLLSVDDRARDGLHVYALAHPAFVRAMEAVSNSGSALAWQIVTVVLTAALLWRRKVRLAVFVVVTNAGSSLVNGLVKTATNRPRPVVDHPLLHEPGLSFPSGHAQAAVVGYGVLALVLAPHLQGFWRRSAGVVAVVMVLAIGFSRVALAVHYVSDVLAAYLLGLAWLVTMTAVFQIWPGRTKGPAHGSPRPRAHPHIPCSETTSTSEARTPPPIARESPSP